MTLGLIGLTRVGGARILVAAEDVASVVEVPGVEGHPDQCQVRLRGGCFFDVIDPIEAIDAAHDALVRRSLPHESITVPGSMSSPGFTIQAPAKETR